jgi:uncharacterized NAD(P)/FAD-binding protein YdhS
MKIAIVGFGVSGAALLMALKTSGKLDKNITVDIFDPNDEQAVGLAYGKDTDRLLANAFPTAMSLNAANKFEFSEWLEKHYPEYDAKVDLVPRTIYGEYATERLTPILEEKNVAYYKNEIIDVHVTKENFSTFYDLKDAAGKQHGSYDYLFLALGTPPYQDFYNLRGVENYLHNPYPVVDKLKDIKANTKVAIIGSGLTAFDIVNYLSHEKYLTQPLGVFTNVPHFNSLRVPPYEGEPLKYSLDKDWIEREFQKNKGVISLGRMVEAIDLDLKANNIDLKAIREIYDPADLEDTYRTYFGQEHPELAKLQAYIALLSGNLGDLYMALSKKDQVRYHLDYAPLFSHYQVRLAPEAVKNMYQLKTDGELFIVPDLLEIDKDENFTLKSSSGQAYQADVVINASGFDYNTERVGVDNPLLEKLLDKGLLLDKDKRGLLVTWPETQVISQLYGQLDTCFYIGPWLANTHYGNNNVKALVQKANEIVENYVEF